MIIDISQAISPSMTVYKNRKEKKPVIKSTRSIKQGARESSILLDSHSGTHFDAPKHILENGKGMESFSLNAFIGQCKVIDLTRVYKISASDLKKLPIKKGDRILFKTKNSSDLKFNAEFVYVDSSAAKYLASKKIALIGIDALGIERSQSNHETHKALLKSGIAILEGLRLKNVKAGKYFLCALPLSIKDIDGSPARAVLIK